MAQSTRLMDSFSQRDRFIWRDDDFHVIIPNGTRTTCYARAPLSFLKSLLIPQLRLTRGGNISQHQPTPPPPQPYDFYLAQLIHYGLDFHFDIEAAQRALEIEIRLGRLQVPPGLIKLEKELKREHNREQKKVHAQVVRYSEKPPRRSNAEAAVSADVSDAESKVQKTQKPATRKSKERKKRAVLENGSKENGEASSGNERSSVSESDSGNENDNIVVAQEIRESTSSSGSSSSSSSSSPAPSPTHFAKAEKQVKRSDSTSSSGGSSGGEFSGKPDNKEDSSDDNPFVDRHDVKRIKPEQADEHKDSILRSTREAAPFVVRKQLPPFQAKVRRIASKTQISTPSGSLAKITSSTTPDDSGKVLAKKPFVSPDKRPSWTIPVRSPSSALKDATPKSVTFSHVERETPTKVLNADKATFSSSLKTSQASPQRTPSFSSDRGQNTPLQSILKRTPSNLERSPAPASAFGSQAELSAQIPREEDRHHAKRRRRKKKSSSEVAFDDTQHSLQTWDGPNEDKPFITSDIVKGKPVSVSSFRDNNFLAGPSHQSYDQAQGVTSFLATNDQAFNQNQYHNHTHTSNLGSDPTSYPENTVTENHKQKHNTIPPSLNSAQPQPHSGSHSDPDNSNTNRNPSASGTSKKSSKHGSLNPEHKHGYTLPNANSNGLRQHVRNAGVNGSGSRGSLVRAGRVY